jgi:hypothetical protein
VLLACLLSACFACERKTPISISSDFSAGRKLGQIDPVLEEASGLVASRKNPGYLWTHNDSGDSARIFLIDEEGKIVFTCYLQGAKNRDWEDIAMGLGPDSTSYLFVADIGDNLARFPYKHIYCFEEPAFRGEAVDTLRQFHTLTLQLDDGIRDSETLLADPVTQNLYLVSKREDAVRLYEVKNPLDADTLRATFQLELPFHNMNGGDISPDGREILLRDYEAVYYWARPAGTTVAEALRGRAKALRYQREAQGEAIAFKLDGSGYYTLSESPEQNWAHVRFYKRN